MITGDPAWDLLGEMLVGLGTEGRGPRFGLPFGGGWCWVGLEMGSVSNKNVWSRGCEALLWAGGGYEAWRGDALMCLKTLCHLPPALPAPEYPMGKVVFPGSSQGEGRSRFSGCLQEPNQCGSFLISIDLMDMGPYMCRMMLSWLPGCPGTWWHQQLLAHPTHPHGL